MTEFLAGRVAVLTGGAGAIAAAIARRLAAEGSRVVVADINADRTRALVGEIEEAGGEALAVVGNLTSAAGVEAVCDATVRAFGGADILVNALGEWLGLSGPFEQSTEEEWQALYEVNLLHVFRLCRAFIPGMKDRGWGRILNFSSVEGIRAAPALAVYTAFKGALDAFTRSVGVDLARYGIRTHCLAVDKTRSYQVGHYRLPPEYEPLIPSFIPAGRYGEPDDIAELAVALLGPAGGWVMGQTIVADGGTLAAGGWYRTPKRWTNQPVLAQYVEDPAISESRPPALQ